ncbi:MAG: InlB B-repeat-containing protein [Firmicutes bacterium]|nr:InlB B-repeat-containing protein [Bacillota bacterium]
MKRSSRTFLSLLLVLSLCLGMMPMSIFADEGTPAEPVAEPAAVENVLDAEEGEEDDSALLDEPAAPVAGEEAGEEAKTEEPAADETKKVNEPLVEVKEEAAPVADEKKAEEVDEELKLDEAKILDVQEGAKLEVLEKAPAEDAAQKGEMLEKAPAEEKKIDVSANDVNSEEEPAPAVEVAADAVLTANKAASECNIHFHFRYPKAGSEEEYCPMISYLTGQSVTSAPAVPSDLQCPEGATLIGWMNGSDSTMVDFNSFVARTFYYNFYAVWKLPGEDWYTVSYVSGFDNLPAPPATEIKSGDVAIHVTPDDNYYNRIKGFRYAEEWFRLDDLNKLKGGIFNYEEDWSLLTEDIAWKLVYEFDYNNKITEDITFIPWWIKTWEVTFDTDGGEPAIEPKIIDNGRATPRIVAVKKEGYELAGWYYLNDAGEKVPFKIANDPVTSDIHLIADWVEVSNVKFYTNYPEGITLDQRSASLSISKEEEPFLAPSPEDEDIRFTTPFGYEFLYWEETHDDPNPDSNQGGGGIVVPERPPEKKRAEADQLKSAVKAENTDATEETPKTYQIGEAVELHTNVYLSAVWGECNTVIYRSMYPIGCGLEDAPDCRVPYKNGEETFRVANYKDDPVNFERPVGYEFAGWERTVIDTEEEYNDFFGVETLPPGIVGPGEGTIVKKAAEMARSETRSEASTSEAVVQLRDIVQPYEKTNTEEDLHVVVVLDALWKKAPLVTYHTNYPLDREDGLPEDNKVSIDPYKGLTDDQDRPEKFMILALDDEELQFDVPDGYEFDGWYIEYNRPNEDQELIPAQEALTPASGQIEHVQEMDSVEHAWQQEAAKSVMKAALRSGDESEVAQPVEALQEADIEKEDSGREDRLYDPDEEYDIYTRVDLYAIWLVKPTVIYHTAYDRNGFKDLEEADYKDPKDYSAKDNPLYSGKDDKDKEKLEVLDFYDIGTERGFVDPDGYVFDYWIMEFRQIGPAANSPVNFFISAAEDNSPWDDEEEVEAKEDYEELDEEASKDDDAIMTAKAVEAKAEKRETVVMKAAKASVPEEAVKESIKDSTVFPAEAAEAAATAESAVAIAAEEKEDPPLVSPDKIKPGDKEDINLFVDFYAVYAPVYVVEYNSNYPEALSLDVQTARDKIKSSKEDVIYNVLSLDEVTEINSDFVAPVGYKFLGWSLDDPDQTEKLMNAPDDTITFPGVKPADEKPTDEQPSTNGKEPLNPGSVKPIDWSNMSNKIDADTLPAANASQAGGTSGESEMKEALPSAMVKEEAKESDKAEQAASFDEKEKDTVDPPESGMIPPEQEVDPGQQAEASNVKPEHIFYAQWEKVYGVYWIDKDGSTDDPLATGTYDTYDPEAFNPADEYNEKKTDDAPTTDKLTYTDEDGVTYVFDHWERIKYDEETKTVVYEAAYRPVDSEKTYTITWVDGDGNVLKTDTVKEGETPNYTGDTPTKSPNGDTTYTFNDKWSPDIVPATEDKTYTAQFDENTPNNPTTPSNPRPNTPATTEDPVEEEPSEIDENDTPLSGFEVDPEEDEPVAENDTPLAGYEEEPDEELSDEAMPFSPFTGDARHTAVWSIISVLSLLGIVLVARKRREE